MSFLLKPKKGEFPMRPKGIILFVIKNVFGKENSMRLSMIYKSLPLGLALMLASGAFAAKKTNKGSFSLSEPTTVSGHQLNPGDYKLKWDGTGPNVELMILSDGKLVATVPAHLINLGTVQNDDAIEQDKKDDGSLALKQIDFAGKRYALSFSNDAMTSSPSE